AALARTVRRADPPSAFKPSVITAMPRRKKPIPPTIATVVSKALTALAITTRFGHCSQTRGSGALERCFLVSAPQGGTDMDTDYTGKAERRHTAEIFRDNWLLFVLLGSVLVVSGAAAIFMPAVSTIPASKVLGTVLVISGLLQIVQSTKMLHWT